MRKSKFAKITEQPQTFTFAPLPATQTTGQWGPRFDYAVNGDQVLTVSQYLYDQIEAGRDPSQPYTLTISRYKNERGATRYNIQEGAVQGQVAFPNPKAPAAAAKVAQRDFDTLVNDMAYCISASKALTELHLQGATTEDIRTIATSLFIEANRSGIQIPRVNFDEVEVEDDDQFPDDPPFDVG